MKLTRGTKDGLGILGFGAAACVACCAGPILAFLGGVSIAGIASTAVLGTFGLAIAATAAVAYLVVRRRRANTTCAIPADEPVLVGAPIRRTVRAQIATEEQP